MDMRRETGTMTAIVSWRRLVLVGVAATGLVGLAVVRGGPGGRQAQAGAPANVPGQIAVRRSASSGRTIRLLFAGDVMLGRGVAPFAASDPEGLFTGIRFEVSSADLAVANLESPLTVRPHDPTVGPNALEARPASAALLAAAGFDAVGIANNHAGDAGPRTVPETIRALSRAGIVDVGGGSSAAQAYEPRIVELGQVRVALLAFDATGQGPRAVGGTPGVAAWNRRLAREAVLRARSEAAVVAVGIHGGTEYMPATDPYVMRLARQLASWGADIVWGQGPHVVQPIRVIHARDHGRPTIVATSLGNLLFDQHIPGTQTGAMLEVVAGADGVRAFRIGSVRATVPVQFLGWRLPQGDAAALGGEWWTLARSVRPAAAQRPPSLAGLKGEVVDAALGDPEGNGGRQLVVAYRSPFRPTNLSPLVPRDELVDRRGLAAHVGLYRPRDLRPLWVAGTLLRPVAAVAACDGAIAVAYSALNSGRIVATDAWRWGGFGFLTLPLLPGRGVAACANVDGRLDPVVLERSPR
jgi:poly-gamma-glutamate synthesis protein (capsule biosynthesis protein)